MKDQTKEQEALSLLRNLHFSRTTTNTTRKAIVTRLVPFLDEEQARFEKWKEVNRFHINITRQKSVERRYIKRIQALKIVIHMLDRERNWIDEEPSFIVKREKLKEKNRWEDEPVQPRIKIKP